MVKIHHSLRLLPEKALIKTSAVDRAEWNYRPLIRRVQRLRFRLVVGLLGEHVYDRILEIGYGSGVFLPELSRHCTELFGLDPHSKNDTVEAILRQHDTSVTLKSGRAESIPFPADHFDCIVAVSSLEYVSGMDAACSEILRVLRPGGVLVLVAPGYSPLVNLGIRLLTGQAAATQYSDNRERLVPTLTTNFDLEEQRDGCLFGIRFIRLYSALRLSKPPLA